jgi:hypothetical protein
MIARLVSRRAGVDLHPFEAIIGEHRNPIALLQAEADERVAEPAGSRIPRAERHRARQVAGGDLVAEQVSVVGDHRAEMRQISHCSPHMTPMERRLSPNSAATLKKSRSLDFDIFNIRLASIRADQ